MLPLVADQDLGTTGDNLLNLFVVTWIVQNQDAFIFSAEIGTEAFVVVMMMITIFFLDRYRVTINDEGLRMVKLLFGYGFRFAQMILGYILLRIITLSLNNGLPAASLIYPIILFLTIITILTVYKDYTSKT